MTALRTFLLIILFSLTSTYFVSTLYNIRKSETTITIPSIALLPESITGAMSLEFKSLAADYIMLHILTFMGEKVLREEPTSKDEWQTIYKAFQSVVNLDPRATDPFILATTTLPWEAGMVKEANEILEKVAVYHPNDYRPYFFLWYNHYHFLKDTVKSTEYLKKAAAIEGSPKYLKPLAARLQLFSGQIEASIAYTINIIETTSDEGMRNYMMKRLDALKKIHFLEGAARQYYEKFGSKPLHLQELVVTKVIKEIPTDPYGGEFYINDAGRIYSTSKLVQQTK